MACRSKRSWPGTSDSSPSSDHKFLHSPWTNRRGVHSRGGNRPIDNNTTEPKPLTIKTRLEGVEPNRVRILSVAGVELQLFETSNNIRLRYGPDAEGLTKPALAGITSFTGDTTPFFGSLSDCGQDAWPTACAVELEP